MWSQKISRALGVLAILALGVSCGESEFKPVDVSQGLQENGNVQTDLGEDGADGSQDNGNNNGTSGTQNIPQGNYQVNNQGQQGNLFLNSVPNSGNIVVQNNGGLPMVQFAAPVIQYQSVRYTLSPQMSVVNYPNFQTVYVSNTGAQILLVGNHQRVRQSGVLVNSVNCNVMFQVPRSAPRALTRVVYYQAW